MYIEVAMPVLVRCSYDGGLLGLEYWERYFKKLSKLLVPDRKSGLQMSIVLSATQYDDILNDRNRNLLNLLLLTLLTSCSGSGGRITPE